MALFNFEVEICLGFSHCGGVYNSADGEVELTDQEVEQLVDLMKETGTSDVEEMKLKEKLPEIYEKLDEAYSEAAYAAEEEHWLDAGYYHEECHDYEDRDMIDYIKRQGAWEFEYDEEEFKDENGELDEEALFDAECDYLHYEGGLDNYLATLHGEERYDFLRNQIGISVEPEGCDYEIEIPHEIIEMAFSPKEK